MKSETKRPDSGLFLPYLDGLRAIAALYVVVHHMLLQVWPEAGGVVAPAALGWLSHGHAAVAFFIVLSGFCLALPAVRNGGELRGGVGGFLSRRARRILPPYYLALVFSLILIVSLVGTKTGTHWDCSVPVTARGLWLHLLLLQNLVGSDEINHVFWSVALEWQIYFLFPLLLLGWRRLGSLATTGAALVVAFGAAFALAKVGLPARSVQFVGLFAVGMLAAEIAFSPRDLPRRLREKTPWGVLLAIFAVMAAFALGRFSTLIADIPVGALSAALLIAVSSSTSGVGAHLRRLPASRPMTWVGAFSYSLYLVHAPLIQVVWQYVLTGRVRLHEMPSFLLLAAVGTPLILAGSYLFFLAGERPFLRRAPETRRDRPTSTEPAVEAAQQPAVAA